MNTYLSSISAIVANLSSSESVVQYKMISNKEKVHFVAKDTSCTQNVFSNYYIYCGTPWLRGDSDFFIERYRYCIVQVRYQNTLQLWFGKTMALTWTSEKWVQITNDSLHLNVCNASKIQCECVCIEKRQLLPQFNHKSPLHGLTLKGCHQV